nr:hypothetical protein [Tanacetum cinerariifolium]
MVSILLSWLFKEPLFYAKLDDLCFFVDTEWFVLASLVFFSPSAGEAVAWPAKGTSLVVASDAFSTTMENLLKKPKLVKLEALLEVPIKCSSVQQLVISLISPYNLVNFEGSSFSSVGKQLVKLCEARSLDILGFREVTRRVVSWLMSGYEGLAFSEVTSALAVAFCCSSSSF